jgi:hypothetical protein
VRSYCNRTGPHTGSDPDGSEGEISRYADGYNIRAVTSRRPIQTGVLGEAPSRVVGNVEENCGSRGKLGSGGGGGGGGTGDGDGEVVRSITFGLECPEDDGRLEGKEVPSMPTVDEG